MSTVLPIAVLMLGAAQHASGQVSIKSDGVMLTQDGGRSLPVSLRMPEFLFEKTTVGGEALPRQVPRDLGTKPTELPFAPTTIDGSGRLEVRLLLQWSPKESVLRKWARFRIVGSSKPLLLKEVILEDLDLSKPEKRSVSDFSGKPIGPETSWQSYPVFMDGFFAGVEFPVASTRVENGHLILAHRPGLRAQPNVWYETRKAVHGTAPVGTERQAFLRYISANRPRPTGFHANYNSWWTSRVPYSEDDILKLMRTFEEKLYKPYGVSFDTFCIDMGWSDPKSFWDINTKLFPDRFNKIEQAAKRMNSNLGLWVSPSNCYSPNSMDNEWAKDNGYETFTAPGSSYRYTCLGGKRYRKAFTDRLVEMVTRYGVRHLKFDGYRPECPEADHGHEPGALSREAIADGIIGVMKAVHKATPDTWIETTCMGWSPSPCWLFHANSVVGTYGDDAPHGRVPCPIYRESYTTARDYFSLQGSDALPVPVAAQEVLGVVHQTEEDFTNDAVMTVMRGNMFMPAYINPIYMSDSRWKAFAEILKWARKNAPALQETETLLPASWQNGKRPRFTNDAVMSSEPYGYAHWQSDRGLVVLRNPWIMPQVYRIKLNLKKGDELSAVSLYPEARLYGRDLRPGGTLDVPLAPYETLVLSIGHHESLNGLAEVAARGTIQAAVPAPETVRVEFEGAEDAFGPDYTSLVGDAKSAVRLNLDAHVTTKAPDSEVLILLEKKTPPDVLSCKIKVNGKEVNAESSSSDSAWAASGMARPEHWLFLRVPLKEGGNGVWVDLLTDDDSPKVSMWIWSRKPGRTTSASFPNALPQPEMISLDAIPLVQPINLASIARQTIREPRPVERIDGVYLDTLEPTSVSQGWGTLQKNRSVAEAPLTINGRRFLRGLGTHASSRIVYNLDDKYRRFQAWAGADGWTAPTITFQVNVDGQKRWESGLMKRDSDAKPVGIDITGAKTLELLVGDGGNGITSDHADWADAKLLR